MNDKKQLENEILSNARSLTRSTKLMWFLYPSRQSAFKPLAASKEYNREHKAFNGSFDPKKDFGNDYNKYIYCCFDSKEIDSVIATIPKSSAEKGLFPPGSNCVRDFIKLPVYLPEATTSDHIIWPWIPSYVLQDIDQSNLVQLMTDYPQYTNSKTNELSQIDDLDEKLGEDKKIYQWQDYFVLRNIERQNLVIDLESYDFTKHAFEITDQRPTFYFSLVFNTQKAAQEACEKLNRDDIYVSYADYDVDVTKIKAYDPKSDSVINCYIDTYELDKELQSADAELCFEDMLAYMQTDQKTVALDDLDEKINWVKYL